MKILVVGSGGREHALCWALSRSPAAAKIYCAPGNAGIAAVAKCVPIPVDEIKQLRRFATTEGIELTIVGGEVPLALGIADEFAVNNLQIIGPSQKSARLESSKSFGKNFMIKHRIPTARYEAANSLRAAEGLLKCGRFGAASSPVVVKIDGLASGKGVVVAENHDEALAALEAFDVNGCFDGPDASGVVLEECLFGKEISLLLFTDGKSVKLMPCARDHKRVQDNDRGPNTGGMGAVTDDALLPGALRREIIETIIEPTLDGMRRDGVNYKGILFLGLMITDFGPRLLEYNVRFGDPEAQAILIRLKSDLAEICRAICAGRLEKLEIEWGAGSSACVVAASAGYPGETRVGDAIHGLNELQQQDDVVVFHGATKTNVNGDFVTAGGRVLGITARGSDIYNARDSAYRAIESVSWTGMHFRRDIGL
jgi:phosphoribosylamine---glycine ligase